MVIVLSYSTPSTLAYAVLRGSTSIVVREVQAENAVSAMLVTLSGIVTEVKEVRENALLPMLVTPLPMFTEVRE